MGRADIVVAAVGVPEMIQGEWIKEGAAVIDVGINRLDDGRLVGDVDYESALPEKSRLYHPVPRGSWSDDRGQIAGEYSRRCDSPRREQA